MTNAPPLAPRLARSANLAWFAHMGAVYLFHDLYGYILEMSADIAELIEAFGGGRDPQELIAGSAERRQFVDVLAAHQVLVDPNEDELAGIWAFVPIKGKWNVWQRRRDRVTLWTAWGDYPIQQILLDARETAMWDAFDGKARLAELRKDHDPAQLLALVRRLVHHDVQALKLSMMPWELYAKRPSMAPPYLSSTMPYARWRPGDPVPAPIALATYYEHTISDGDADLQFDHRETTLSHLLRIAHPALGGRSYGTALADKLVSATDPPRALRVLEIGGGLGYVARDAIARLRERGVAVDYTIVELSPVLARAQRAVVGGDTRWVAGDVLAVELPAASFDVIVANEMVGDLPALALTREQIGLASEGGTSDPAKLRACGAAIAAELALPLDDAPAEFYLQTGALELVARLARWLAPGGVAVITEFGDRASYPRLSTHLDHPELSTHFGHLAHAARAAGLDASIEFVIDLLEFDRTQQGLATTRSHFRALRAMFAEAGIELAKIGYTPDLLARAVDGKLDLADVGELRWHKIEDRLMGLVPHEFKALVARARG